jgi:hypothetical protein
MFGYYYRYGPKISNRLGLTLILIYVGLSFGFVYLSSSRWAEGGPKALSR